MTDDGIHTDENEGNVNGDWGYLLQAFSGWIDNEWLIDDNGVNDKSNDRKEF